MTLENLVNSIDDENIVELYIGDSEEPIFANRNKFFKEEIFNIFHSTYIWITSCSDFVKLMSKYKGYSKSGIVLRASCAVKDDIEVKDWWTHLMDAKVEDIKDLLHNITMQQIVGLINQSSNDIAKMSLKSGKIESLIEDTINDSNIEDILLLGVSKLDILNARNNPSNSELYKNLFSLIEEALQGDSGKKMMSVLFDQSTTT